MSDASPAAALDQPERVRLARLESVIEKAVNVAGQIAGEPLAIIRDEKLYRVTHHTFEAYVQDRFGFTVRTAYRMIEVATAPERPRREVEGSRQAVTNPQPDEAEEVQPPLPAQYQPIAADAARLWAYVEVVDPLAAGRLVLALDPLAELPAAGTRVLVAWER